MSRRLAPSAPDEATISMMVSLGPVMTIVTTCGSFSANQSATVSDVAQSTCLTNSQVRRPGRRDRPGWRLPSAGTSPTARWSPDPGTCTKRSCHHRPTTRMRSNRTRSPGRRDPRKGCTRVRSRDPPVTGRNPPGRPGRPEANPQQPCLIGGGLDGCSLCHGDGVLPPGQCDGCDGVVGDPVGLELLANQLRGTVVCRLPWHS